MKEDKKTLKFGEGLRIKGVQLKILKDATVMTDAEELAETLQGNLSRIKMYGEDTKYVAITKETSLDFKLEQHKPVGTEAQIDTYKAVEDLYADYDPIEETTENAFFQFHVEDNEGDEFYFNTGSIRSDHLPYIMEDTWDAILNYQGWVDEQRDAEYEPDKR